MQVGNYILRQLLGEGGMGQVWLAHHIHLGTPAVVKSLHPQYAQNEQLRQRFLTEARLLVQLRHPAVVQLYDFTIQEGTPYLIMEYVQGESLDKYIQSRGHLSLNETIGILSPIFEALNYLHSQRILHRDVKPSNIIVRPDGTGKLIDFGIAKALDEDLRLTQTGMQIGTVLYMAPEQIKGEPVSPQTDLYAMGLVVYECLLGKFPWKWEGLTAFQLYQRLLTEPPAFPSAISPSWRAFFEKALAKEPSHRFSSAAEMREVLVTLSREQVSSLSQGQPTFQDAASNDIASKSSAVHVSTSRASKDLSSSGTATSGKTSTKKGLLLLILGIVGGIVIGGGIILLLIRDFSTDTISSPAYVQLSSEPVKEVSQEAPRSDISARILRDLSRYLDSYIPPEGVRVIWGSPPETPLYESKGTLSVPVTVIHNITKEEDSSVFDDCYTAQEEPYEGPYMRVFHYQVQYACTTSDYARVHYEYHPESDYTDFSLDLPSPSEANCQEQDRVLIHVGKRPCG
ncbi:MAG: serine/threonine-protein kinase [Bacteroidia bacterium]